MRVLVMAGFLGSGKTTAIISLAKALSDRELKIAIIVNEIGEIGVDDQVLRQLDFDVWELLSGCICCSLAGDLLQTLDKLDHEYKVDLVLVEPSGAANPQQIIGALRGHSAAYIESIFTAVIIDPLRLAELMAILGPLISSQLELADLIIVSKADLASTDNIRDAEKLAQSINRDASVISGSLKGGLQPGLEQELLPWLN
jgi:G3E family GTPase